MAAFKGVETSAEFVFPSNLTDIGDAAFMYSGFNFGDAVLRKSLSVLGTCAFSGCLALESVDLSQSAVTDINEYVILSENAKLEYKSMGYYSLTGEPQITETRFIGYTGTVAKYASSSYEFTFESLGDSKDDLNFDGLIDKLNIQLLQECLVNNTKQNDKEYECADILEDGLHNVFDAALLKRDIIESNEK